MNNSAVDGHRRLDDWLAARDKQFADWACLYSGSWDFSGDSVAALISLMKEQLSGVEDLKNPDFAAFVDGAVWYLGEVFRRTLPGAYWSYWSFRYHGAADVRDIADYYVCLLGDSVSPYYMLMGKYEGLGTIGELYKHWQARVAEHDHRG